MNTTTYAERRDKLRTKMNQAELGWLLVSHAANRFYLSGFELHDPQCNESSGLLLLGPDPEGKQDWLLTDPRYHEEAKRHWPEERVFIYSGKKDEVIRDFLADSTDSPMGFEAKSIHVDFHTTLSESLELKPTSGLVEDLRLIKDTEEISVMRRSCKLNHDVFARVPEFLVPGRTEKQVAWDIEKTFREMGAEELAFSTIVAVAGNGALPHAIPGQTKIEAQCPVLVDMGARLGDYCSDQTRTFWVGENPPDYFQRTLDQVCEAQEAAMAVMQPGLPVRDAYLEARASFEKHGVEQHFTHALGHGIGLETHEPPSLSTVSEQTLKPGMVVTVEPGLYYPEWGGVRWEYMVLVTETGVEPL